MSRRIVGKFWKYDGNSLNGRSHERRIPEGYDLYTVTRVAAAIDDVECFTHYGHFADQVTKDEAAQMEIVHHKGDSFGHEVTVKAPKSVWDKMKYFV